MAAEEIARANGVPAVIETNTLAAEGNAATITSTGAGILSLDKHEQAKPSSVDGGVTEATTPIQEMWAQASKHAQKEIWGVTLADPATHVPTQIILQKYLNANDGNVANAREQLKRTLDWRFGADPTDLIQKYYPKNKFAKLGYVTTYTASPDATPDQKEIFTWNTYGGVDIQKSFGDLDAFIEWRVALMEIAMREFDLPNATKPITADEDPYKIYQVHDYKGISFFRSPPAVRTAAKKTIDILAMAYPETLKEKFFLNVPMIMGFMYGVMKVFVAAKTINKFHPMSNGGLLALEFGNSKVPGLGEKLPKAYGGKGEELSIVGKEPLLE